MKQIALVGLTLLGLSFSVRHDASAASPACAGDDLAKAKTAMAKAKDVLKMTIANMDNGDANTADLATKWLGVKNSIEAKQVKDILSLALALGGSPTFLCDNSTFVVLGDVYASVNPNDTFAIKLGAFFWSAPNQGFDSKPGTLIHELTHFNIVGALDDFKNSGYPAGALSLASSNPAGARRNANNYEYFVEAVALGANL